MKAYLMIIPIIFMITGIYFIVKSIIRKYKCTLAKQAEVIDMIQYTEDDGLLGIPQSYCIPVLRYIDGDDFYTYKAVNLTDYVGSIHLGDTIAVKINPNNKHQVYLNGMRGNYDLGLGFTILGILIFSVCIFPF